MELCELAKGKDQLPVGNVGRVNEGGEERAKGRSSSSKRAGHSTMCSQSARPPPLEVWLIYKIAESQDKSEVNSAAGIVALHCSAKYTISPSPYSLLVSMSTAIIAGGQWIITKPYGNFVSGLSVVCQ